MAGYAGIIAYEPRSSCSRCARARASPTSRRALAAERQMLPFEPPRFGDGGHHRRHGGVQPLGPAPPLCGRRARLRARHAHRERQGRGPRRSAGASSRTSPGYDVSRLMAGALGTLGVLTELSFKVLPQAAGGGDARLRDGRGANDRERRTGGRASRCRSRPRRGRRACCACACRARRARWPRRGRSWAGAKSTDGPAYWEGLREHRLPFFASDRAAVAPFRARRPRRRSGSPIRSSSSGEEALRWVSGDSTRPGFARRHRSARGHATLFRGGDRGAGVFHPLAPAIAKIHRRLKDAFDPAGHPQSRPHGQLLTALDANQSRRLDQGHAAGPRGRRDPAQMRALRLLPRHLSHLQPAGRRAGQPARAHLPHEAGLRGRARHRAHAGAPRPVPHLPRLRDDLPLGRAVRPPRRHRPRGDREEGAARIRRRRVPPRCCVSRSSPGRSLPSAWAWAARCAPLLPRSLAKQVPPRREAGAWPAARHARRMIVLDGCVQPTLAPDINAATARVLDRLGISLVSVAAGGLLRRHRAPPQRAGRRARPRAPAGGRVVAARRGGGGGDRDHGERLRHDGAGLRPPARAATRPTRRRRRASPKLATDVGQVVAAEREALARLLAGKAPVPEPVAYHAPCSLQHGLKQKGIVESILRDAGFTLTAVPDSHVCCGSAGTYSILQPELSGQLLANKVKALESGAPCGDLHLQHRLPAAHRIGCLEAGFALDRAPRQAARGRGAVPRLT